MSRVFTLILAAFGGGAPNSGTANGPQSLQAAAFWPQLRAHFRQVIVARTKESPKNIHSGRAIASVFHFCRALKWKMMQIKQGHDIPVVIGGDHTVAMGTWSAVLKKIKTKSLGLIWIDAHMDAHTRCSSLSQSPHGMPVAVLLGEGEPILQSLLPHHVHIQSQHLILMGVRSYEAGEAARLKRLGVKVYLMEEIKARGFDVCWAEALHSLETQCDKIGLSVDLDGFDPKAIPGVGSRAKDGLDPQEVKKSLQHFLHHPKCAGLEIAEFNPFLDQDHRTANFIFDLIVAAMLPFK